MNWYKQSEEEDFWRLKGSDLKNRLGTETANIDNPGGNWLEYEKSRAEESFKKGFIGGAVTARFNNVMVPVEELLKLEGIMGEHLRLTLQNPRVRELAEDILKNGLKQSPFINVAYNGDAKINEGNHRVRAAFLAGLKIIPIEIAYFAGGERSNGPMSLKRLIEFRNEFGETY